MGICTANRAHFVQDNRNTGLGQLPCRFGTGQAAADDMYGSLGHV